MRQARGRASRQRVVEAATAVTSEVDRLIKTAGSMQMRKALSQGLAPNQEVKVARREGCRESDKGKTGARTHTPSKHACHYSSARLRSSSCCRRRQKAGGRALGGAAAARRLAVASARAAAAARERCHQTLGRPAARLRSAQPTLEECPSPMRGHASPAPAAPARCRATPGAATRCCGLIWLSVAP